jgi:hypothetical protein
MRLVLKRSVGGRGIKVGSSGRLEELPAAGPPVEVDLTGRGELVQPEQACRVELALPDDVPPIDQRQRDRYVQTLG